MASSTPTAMPGSMSCSPVTGSPKQPVGRMYDANSSMSMPRPARPSQKKRSIASASSIAVEKTINGAHRPSGDEERQQQSKPIAEALAPGPRRPLRQLSRKSELARAFRYMRSRWTALIRCFDDGRLALDNNPAERALRCVAIGRKNYLFAGSDAGGRRAAAIYSLIESAKLNGLEPAALYR